MRILLLSLMLLTACHTEPSMNDRVVNRDERVRAYLDAVVARGTTPGVQYLVVNASHTQFAYAGGWADIARRMAMTPSTTMMAYSMSKTITAAAVLQLVEGGRIALDSPVAMYLDSLPYGRDITVRQLLAHTSGLPNPIPLRWVHPAARHVGFDETGALDSIVRAHPRLSFPPGSKYAYSNIGYWLLGRLVERTSGESFATYVRTHVFEPLDIPSATLGYAVPDPAHHATGYLAKYSLTNFLKRLLIDGALIGDYQGSWLSIHSHYVNGPGFGGLVGTAGGFGRFLEDQLAPQSRIMSDATRRLFYEQQRTTGGAPIAMTLGWHIGERNGEQFYYKEGGGGGFHSMMRIYPGRHIATIVMTNATGFDVKRLLEALDPEFFEQP